MLNKHKCVYIVKRNNKFLEKYDLHLQIKHYEMKYYILQQPKIKYLQEAKVIWHI